MVACLRIRTGAIIRPLVGVLGASLGAGAGKQLTAAFTKGQVSIAVGVGAVDEAG